MRSRLASLIVVKQEPLDDYGVVPPVEAVELNNNGSGVSSAGQYRVGQSVSGHGYSCYAFGNPVPSVCYGGQQDLNNNNQQQSQAQQDFHLFHEKKCMYCFRFLIISFLRFFFRITLSVAIFRSTLCAWNVEMFY